MKTPALLPTELVTVQCARCGLVLSARSILALQWAVYDHDIYERETKAAA